MEESATDNRRVWSRWHKEYVVIRLKNDLHYQNHRTMTWIVETFADKHGDVQNIKLHIGRQSNCGTA